MRKPAAQSAKTLTDEQLAKLKENAIGILANGRKIVLDRFPFIGSIAMSLDLVPTRDCRCPTMATDGQAIYCDIDFLNGLTNDDMVFIVAHEVYHCVMLHSMRRENRDPKIFNYAADIEVNGLLAEDGMPVPRDVLTASTYNFKPGLSAEAYYDLLLENAKIINLSSMNGSSGGGNKDGKLEGQFDKHVYKNDSSNSETGNDGLQDSYGKVGYDPDFRPDFSESAIERVREAAITAAQNIERQGGTLPNHIKQLVSNLLEPKLNWKELLAKFVTKSTGQTRTWNRPNRRFAGRGVYLPSTYGHKMKIAVGIDTSGSVTEYVKRFISELNGLVKSFGEYELTIIQCDTQVQRVDSYSTDNPIDLEHTKFELEGFGGTILKPIFDYVEKEQLDVDCIAVLTDGYLADIFESNYKPTVPVLWCVTKDGTKEPLTFGEIVDLDD